MDNVSKHELIERIEHASSRLNDVLKHLEPDARIGTWSLSDFLAHLIAHEQCAMAEIKAAIHGEVLVIDHRAINEFNQGAVFSSRLYTFAVVHPAWLESVASVLEFVNALPDEVFEASNPVTDILEDSIDGALANNTYKHYLEHLPKLLALFTTQ
jgi:hypothetical protein